MVSLSNHEGTADITQGGIAMAHRRFRKFNTKVTYPEQSLDNDYMIDREAQRTWKSFTGIPGVRQQDMAVTESMGPIYKRYAEHLGTTDAMIIRTRRKLLATAKALRDEGVIPPGVDNPEVYRQRSGEVILPRDVFWWDATKPLREVFEVEEIPAEFTPAR